MKKILLLSFVAYSLMFSACDKKNSQMSSSNTPPKPRVIAPTFNEDSAYQYIANQVGFGPRVPNLPSHVKCGNYLIDFFKAQGWSVSEQAFDGKAFNGAILRSRNIIASYNPDSTKRILLAAHWDTRPFADQDSVDKYKPIDGANDGGSGVAVLMELARILKTADKKPSVGIDIVLFDSEDYGAPEELDDQNRFDDYCLGSQYWAKNMHRKNFYFGILLDMVGGKNARFAQEGHSLMYAAEVNKKVWKEAELSGFANYFTQEKTGGILDDHYYVNTVAKVPMIDIIEYQPEDGSYFSATWHKHSDKLENIDKNTLKAVGQTLLQVIYNE